MPFEQGCARSDRASWAVKAGLLELGVGELGPLELGVGEAGLPSLGALEAGLLELCAVDTGPPGIARR